MKNKNMIYLAVGFILLLLAISAGGRTAKPYPDDIQSDFKLLLVASSDNALAGQPYPIDLQISNTQATEGRMWVQCSILDKAQYPFLTKVRLDREASIDFVSSQENCVAQEPNTLTARVVLDANEKKVFRFNVMSPKVAAEPVLYCAAYEQCYFDGVNTGTTDEFQKSITLVQQNQPNDGSVEGVQVVSTDACTKIVDCPGYLTSIFTGEKISCNANNLCVYTTEPVQKPQDLTDNYIITWAKEHTVLVWVLAGIFLTLGVIGIYYQPPMKKPVLPFFKKQ